ncbi:lysostaphin resistance A-like protein [Candidatus Lokiarchaeum ossiferum]|uniref:lysostaphin resistance A-like protein n=1 Tax=Candidatus Lokiarchaeum ossiferum TaxID=2951803 RepID=UPI00352F2353
MSAELSGRIRFFLMVLFSGILNVIIYFILRFFVDLFSLSLVYEYTLLRLLHMGGSIFSIFLGVLITNYFIPETTVVNNPNSLSLDRPVVSTQKISQSLFDGFNFQNLLSQLKIALILLSCIYVPLDFLSYLIPGVLEFTANSLDATNPDNYFLLDSSINMLIFTAIIHFSIAVREEFIYREFFISMGEEHVQKGTAFLYSAILFGLAHVNYIFDPANKGLSPLYPIWWGINALIIGFVSSYQFSKKKQIFPLILAHWINNLLSAVVVRNHILEIPFWSETFFYIYLPFFILGIVLIFITRKSIKGEYSQFFSLFKAYKIENPDKKYYAIDALMIILLWLVSFLF